MTQSAAVSGSSTRPPAYMQVPEPPTTAPPRPPSSATHFSTVERDVRAGAVELKKGGPEQWTPEEVATLKNQEAHWVFDLRDTYPT